MIRRFGKRKWGGELEVNEGVTVKKINIAIKDIGFRMDFTGYDEYWMPHYAFSPIGRVTHHLTSPEVMVYALGDRTVAQWKSYLLRMLYDEHPEWRKAAYERERLRRNRRKRKQK